MIHSSGPCSNHYFYTDAKYAEEILFLFSTMEYLCDRLHKTVFTHSQDLRGSIDVFHDILPLKKPADQPVKDHICRVSDTQKIVKFDCLQTNAEQCCDAPSSIHIASVTNWNSSTIELCDIAASFAIFSETNEHQNLKRPRCPIDPNVSLNYSLLQANDKCAAYGGWHNLPIRAKLPFGWS